METVSQAHGTKQHLHQAKQDTISGQAQVPPPAQHLLPGDRTVLSEQSSAPPQGQLMFSSAFEGGNIAGVQVTDDGLEYEISLRGDTCNVRHRLWYQFQVSNAAPAQQAVLTVVNFSKTRSLYRHGMSPVVRSAKSPAWQRVAARNTFYYKSPKHANRYVLSFAFVFEAGDTYEFAYSFPFSYTSLQYELGYLEFMGAPFLRRQQVTRTPQQRRVEALVISQPLMPCPLEGFDAQHLPANAWLRPRPGDPQPALSPAAAAGVGGGGSGGRRAWPARPVVFITSRVHPGETPSSYVTQGLIAFLMSSDPQAVALRSAITWVIIPMLNPDGVFLGNYRADAGGVDLNRMWLCPMASTMPALHHTLRLIQAYANHPAFEVSLFIDIHAHSTSQRSFLFGNKPRASDAAQQEAAERLPRLLSAHMPGFSLSCCNSDDSAAKAGCARRVVGELVPGASCYTLEISFFHTPDVVLMQPGDAGNTDQSNTIEGYVEQGRGLALAILEYFGLSPGQHQSAAGSGGALGTPEVRVPSPGRKARLAEGGGVVAAFARAGAATAARGARGAALSSGSVRRGGGTGAARPEPSAVDGRAGASAGRFRPGVGLGAKGGRAKGMAPPGQMPAFEPEQLTLYGRGNSVGRMDHAPAAGGAGAGVAGGGVSSATQARGWPGPASVATAPGTAGQRLAAGDRRAGAFSSKAILPRSLSSSSKGAAPMAAQPHGSQLKSRPSQ